MQKLLKCLTLSRWRQYWQGAKRYASVNWQCWRQQFSTVFSYSECNISARTG